MSDELLKKEFIDKYIAVGEQKFYKFLLNYAINKLIKIAEEEYKGTSPELELLNYSDKFLHLFRREGDITYLEISKLFRKSAHKIYRMMIKKNIISKNNRFLNLV